MKSNELATFISFSEWWVVGVVRMESVWQTVHGGRQEEKADVYKPQTRTGRQSVSDRSDREATRREMWCK